MRKICLLCVLMLTPWVSAQVSPTTKPSTPVPANVTAYKDLIYRTGGDASQSLDLFVPKGVTNPPLVVFIHGGGWHTGSKDRFPAMFLTRHGFAVASINYRLVPNAIFPAQISDCRAAIRFLRKNAEKYGFDGSRIGGWGNSAGGHLVALLGTGADTKELDADNKDTDGSCALQAVVDFFGPTEFLIRPTTGSQIGLFGGKPTDKKALATLASPIQHIHDKVPPFLIMHGDADKTVPIEQSQLLADALKAKGLTVTFETVPDGGHGFPPAVYDEKVRTFFQTHLGKKSK